MIARTMTMPTDWSSPVTMPTECATAAADSGITSATSTPSAIHARVAMREPKPASSARRAVAIRNAMSTSMPRKNAGTTNFAISAWPVLLILVTCRTSDWRLASSWWLSAYIAFSLVCRRAHDEADCGVERFEAAGMERFEIPGGAGAADHDHVGRQSHVERLRIDVVLAVSDEDDDVPRRGSEEVRFGEEEVRPENRRAKVATRSRLGCAIPTDEVNEDTFLPPDAFDAGAMLLVVVRLFRSLMLSRMRGFEDVVGPIRHCSWRWRRSRNEEAPQREACAVTDGTDSQLAARP